MKYQLSLFIALLALNQIYFSLSSINTFHTRSTKDIENLKRPFKNRTLDINEETFHNEKSFSENKATQELKTKKIENEKRPFKNRTLDLSENALSNDKKIKSTSTNNPDKNKIETFKRPYKNRTIETNEETVNTNKEIKIFSKNIPDRKTNKIETLKKPYKNRTLTKDEEALSSFVENKSSIISEKKLNTTVSFKKPFKNRTHESKIKEFFPEERIKTFSSIMAKYFTRFAKLAYCDLNIFVKNPVCESIKMEWIDVLTTRYVKVLRSKGKAKKKVIFSCATPSKLFKLQEDTFVTKEEGHYNNTFFGEFDFFNKLYKKMISFTNELFLFDSLKKYLEQDEIGNVQVFFIGHSYGGVVCNLLALRAFKRKSILKHRRKTSPVLITYGSPNIGGKKFADITEERIPLVFRVIVNKDALPTYPRTLEENLKIKQENISRKEINNIGKYIVINSNDDNYEICPSAENKADKCQISTNYMSYDNKFYFNDNIAGISPKSEFNKAWDSAAAIGSAAYSTSK